ncbi:hypothetical protein AB3N59_08260 [Leptospira sp. WS92.C1]
MRRILYFTFSISLILFGIISAYQLRWIADDAFISLRYAKNFAEGKGLVFNAGEYTEGYTNFLWTLLLVPFQGSETIDPVNVTYFFGIFSFFGTCVYLMLFGLQASKRKFHFPFALAFFVLIHHNRVFATGGLETSLHGFLFLAASYHLLSNSKDSFFSLFYRRALSFKKARNLQVSPEESVKNGAHSYDFVLGIIASSLSCLNRPDGLLFHALVGLYLILYILPNQKINFIKIPVFHPRIIIACVLYISPIFFYIWKLEYYGNILPNTFYAKSGGSGNLFQGILYLGLFLKMYYALIPIFGVAVFEFLRTIRHQVLRRNLKTTQNFRWILLFLFPMLYGGYYTWIGGDFMFSRFYLPILPLLFVWVELRIDFFLKLFPKLRKISTVMLYSLPILLILRWDIYKGSHLPIVYGISDENQIYKRESTERIKTQSLRLKRYFENSKVKVGFVGAECILIYYLNPELAIETEAGLTDPYIARLKTTVGARVGHGKVVPIDYLQKRNVHLLLYTNGLSDKTDYNEFLTGEFAGPWRILNYSPSVMKELKKITSFSFVEFETYLDSYQKEYLKLKPELRRKKYQEFDQYYFRNGEDPQRHDWYKKRL